MARKKEIEFIELIKSCFQNIGYVHIESCNCDKDPIFEAFNTIKEYPDENQFPDFIFSHGVMEHFIITGYKESKKGSAFKIEEAKNNKKTESFFKEEDDKFLKSVRDLGSFYTVSHKNIYDNSIYQDFVCSFIKNFSNHMESLKKSKYCNEIVIFLIEQEDGRLSIFENNHFKRFYLLSEDKNLLLYLEEQYPLVNYVIFNSADSVEVIDLSNIDSLISKAKNGLDIRSGRKVDLTLKNYIDL